MIQHGRDTYRKMHSPLFAATLDRRTLQLPTQKPGDVAGIREGDRALHGANPMYDESLYEVLYELSRVTDDPRYAKAADDVLGFFLNHCQSPVTGLMAWGEHLTWDFEKDGLTQDARQVRGVLQSLV